MSGPRPIPQQPATPGNPPLRVIAGGAKKGRAADQLKNAERPAARFWDETAAPPTPQAATPAAPAAPPATGLPELLAFMTAQTALIQEMLSEQRRLRERLDRIETSGNREQVKPE